MRAFLFLIRMSSRVTHLAQLETGIVRRQAEPHNGVGGEKREEEKSRILRQARRVHPKNPGPCVPCIVCNYQPAGK